MYSFTQGSARVNSGCRLPNVLLFVDQLLLSGAFFFQLLSHNQSESASNKTRKAPCKMLPAPSFVDGFPALLFRPGSASLSQLWREIGEKANKICQISRLRLKKAQLQIFQHSEFTQFPPKRLLHLLHPLLQLHGDAALLLHSGEGDLQGAESSRLSSKPVLLISK